MAFLNILHSLIPNSGKRDDKKLSTSTPHKTVVRGSTATRYGKAPPNTHQLCQNDGSTWAVISEVLRFLSPFMRGGGAGRKRWCLLFSLQWCVCSRTRRERSNRNCTYCRDLSSSYTPTSHLISVCTCSSFRGPLRRLALRRRQDNDGTRLRTILSRLGNGTS